MMRAHLLASGHGGNDRGADPARDAVMSATGDDLHAFITEFNRSYRALVALPVPTVAAVRGAVFGGGVELALSCDFIVAAQDATIRHMEVTLGSMPMAGGVQRLADRIGRTRAARTDARAGRPREPAVSGSDMDM